MEQPSLSQTCAEYFQRHQNNYASLATPTLADAETFAFGVDGMLNALFCAGRAKAQPKGAIALVAVGGYGRKTLALRADLDIAILTDAPDDPAVRELLDVLLYPLWDAKIPVSHSVHGVEEMLALAHEDLRVATTLMDLRFVAGDRELVTALQKKARRAVLGGQLPRFIRALSKECEARHRRYGSSLFLLEPEVKNGKGGLRDADVIQWVSQARWNARSEKEMIRVSVIPPAEVSELREAKDFLWRVRFHLHRRAKRQQDRLTFSDQEDVAEDLGFEDREMLAVEQFMGEYYRAARTIAQACSRMLDRATPPKRRGDKTLRALGNGISVFSNPKPQLTFTKSAALRGDPALAFRLYAESAARMLPLYPFARDTLLQRLDERPFRESLRDSPAALDIFRQLLTRRGTLLRQSSSDARNSGFALPPDFGGEAELAPTSIYGGRTLAEELHDVGLLGAMLPPFDSLTGRVYHDVFHFYTADIHALFALRWLLMLPEDRSGPGTALAAHLYASTAHRYPMVLAVLLHALAKYDDSEHGAESAALAKPALEELGLSKADVAHTCWLIEKQGHYYHWATRRDHTDPAVVQELAGDVRSTDRLRELHLVSSAILAATNPGALTPWKARLMESLYATLSAELEGRYEDRTGRASDIRGLALALLPPDAKRGAAFVHNAPERLLLSNPPEAIARFARFVEEANGETNVDLKEALDTELYELRIFAADRPGLLADITAALAALHVEVADAQIYTLDNFAIDVFLIQKTATGHSIHPRGTLSPARREAITNSVLAAVNGEVSREALMRKVHHHSSSGWARRKRPHVETEIRIDNRSSMRFTIIDVFNRDATGVLHCIAEAIRECGASIALAKVNTEGERVADIFYVTRDGKKIENPALLEHLRETIANSLASLSSDR